MSIQRKQLMWIIWTGFMLALIAYFGFSLLASKDKSVFMPGELSGGHHQIGIACSSCHGDSGFTNKDAMQQSCIDCHGEQREKPFDSHPIDKFTDPRNADRLQNINAVYCATCHVEHNPQLADKMGVTQPTDFCIHCHQDIAKDRPSHKGMEFDTCASAGCHNYHNNRALYTDFLVKHMDSPEHKSNARVAEKEFASVLEEIMTYPHEQYPVKELSVKDIDSPVKVTLKTSEQTRLDWLSTAHAKKGASCNACHLVEQPAPTGDANKLAWTDTPDHNACVKCHDIEVKHFLKGKHGMRLAQGLSPMSPAMARLPMKDKAHGQQLGCNSCHQAHQFKTDTASVEACLGCHNDNHSLAYKQSPHFALWEKEQSAEAPSGSGVSCATCHMPRVNMDVNDWLSRTVVQHNQNANLVPNEKMIRSSCLNCHGLGFSIDALADPKLIENNFSTRPSQHIKSIDMARSDNQRHLEATGGQLD